MSTWNTQRAQRRAAPVYARDFTCTDVDMFCSSGSKGAMTLKKVRKDRREAHTSRPLLDNNPRKLKERPSWLGITRQPSSSLASAGSWRQVTCNLQDGADGAILRLYTEDEQLQHSVQIDVLLASELRIVDPTLLMRRHVLAITGHGQLNIPATPAALSAPQEPIYLAFRERDVLNTWLILLRSFARPDIRPQVSSYSSIPRTPYRIWRQLQVTVISGRKFGDAQPTDRVLLDESNLGLKPRDKDIIQQDRHDVFIEVSVNGVAVGRTGVKQAAGPVWYPERITVQDPDIGAGSWAGSSSLGMDVTSAVVESSWGLTSTSDTSSGLLELRVWQARPGLFGPPTAHIATIPIDLGPFRRGEAVKAWWPGYPIDGRGFQDGELLLEIKLDEEIIAPLEMYRKMKEILARRNYFELWRDLTERIPLPSSVSHYIISLAQHHATLAPHLSALACADINDLRTSPSTLFRGNSTLTRVAEVAMGLLGARGFLESSLGGVVRKLYKDRVVFDVGVCGPSGSGSVGGAPTALDSADLMAHWLQETWDSIWRARVECPEELRYFFFQIRTHIEARWGNSPTYADLKYQAISAFLFLRFFIPTLLRPDQHGLVIGAPPEGVERSLKSLARGLQSLANLNATVQREEFMRSIKMFSEGNVDAMIDYLIFVSTPSERSTIHPNGYYALYRSPRESEIHSALHARLSGMPPIHRESLSVLPYMSDEARDLAAIAAAVVRNARMPRAIREKGEEDPATTLPPSDEAIGGDQEEPTASEVFTSAANNLESRIDVLRFIKACFEVEAEAVRRASPQVTPAKKKNPKRRRRAAAAAAKAEGKLTYAREDVTEPQASTTAEPNPPSVEIEMPKEVEAKSKPSPRPPQISGLSTYNPPPIIGPPNSKPDIMREMSHIESLTSDAKPRRRGVLRFMPRAQR